MSGAAQPVRIIWYNLEPVDRGPAHQSTDLLRPRCSSTTSWLTGLGNLIGTRQGAAARERRQQRTSPLMLSLWPSGCAFERLQRAGRTTELLSSPSESRW